jgi:uncharacterized protein (TIGR02145 family)
LVKLELSKFKMKSRIIQFFLLIIALIAMNCAGEKAHRKNKQKKEQSPLSKEVKVGNQIWMTSNLDVAKFQNGDWIPHAKTSEQWIKASDNKQPAWCHYGNLSSNGKLYGKLYNWYAITDKRGLAPKGWRIPTDQEWSDLIEAAGGENEAGAKLKSEKGWNENGNGNNEYDFTGLPAGVRLSNGDFGSLGYLSYWWSSNEKNSKMSYYRLFYQALDRVDRIAYDKGGGLSVRCVRDLNQ